MPNTTLLSPCNYEELDRMLEYAVSEAKGLVAVRYPRGSQSDVLAKIPSSEGFGPRVIREGSNVAILSLGIMAEQALEAADELAEKGIDWTMTDEKRAAYESKLNITGNGVMGYIKIQKIDVFERSI